MKQLVRYPDWRGRLVGYLNSVAARRFRPGRHDCALFVAGGIEAMTGVDLAAEWRGGYSSLEGGRALLVSDGFSGPDAVLAARLSEVAPIFLAAGDAAVVADGDGQPALGLVQGPAVYVLRPAGLGLVSLTDALRGFRV